MTKDYRRVDAELVQVVLLVDTGFLREIVERVVQQLLEAEPIHCDPDASESSRWSACSQIFDDRCFLASPGIWVGANARLTESCSKGNERSLCASWLSPRTSTSRAKGAAR